MLGWMPAEPPPRPRGASKEASSRSQILPRADGDDPLGDAGGPSVLRGDAGSPHRPRALRSQLLVFEGKGGTDRGNKSEGTGNGVFKNAGGSNF